MPGVVRQGDANSAGGVATGGVGSVLVNGRPIVVDGTAVTGHPPFKRAHKGPNTSGGLGNVLAGGVPVNVQGNPDTCGHTRSGSSSDVIAG
jgi:uncharacterized Zn-binding protein involved in type VI secretion